MHGVFPYLEKKFVKTLWDVGLGNVTTLDSTSQR